MMCLLNLNLVSLYARQGEARAGRKRYGPRNKIVLARLPSRDFRYGARFQSFHFVEAPHKTRLVGEGGGQKGFNQFARQALTHNAGADDEYVHIVVLHAGMRGTSVVASGGANTRYFVRSYSHAHP